MARLLFGAVLALLAAGGSRQPPAFLREPGYYLEKLPGHWSVRKPKLRVLDGAAPAEAWTIYTDPSRTAAENRMNALPRLRFNVPLARFNPLTQQRTVVEDWAAAPDAQEATEDVQAIVRRFAPMAVRALISSTPVYMARLNGAFAHTAEEPDDPRRFVIYIDPFRATGRLHAAASLVHELAHVERFRSRGFHANRAASILPRSDFILLGVVDELEAIQAEAALIVSFLDGLPDESLRQSARQAMRSGEFRFPAALRMLLGLEGPAEGGLRLNEVRRQVAIDLSGPAERYWALYSNRRLPREVDAPIRDWYSRSAEWKAIARQRPVWARAGAHL